MDNAKLAEAWRVMRIQSELVDGIEQLIKLGPAVTVFGSARLPENDVYYEDACRLGQLLAEAGLAVITGGGPGKSTETLVYKVYNDGFVNLLLGSSAAQSVILMIIVIALTAVQFRYIDRRVHYG